METHWKIYRTCYCIFVYCLFLKDHLPFDLFIGHVGPVDGILGDVVIQSNDASELTEQQAVLLRVHVVLADVVTVGEDDARVGAGGAACVLVHRFQEEAFVALAQEAARGVVALLAARWRDGLAFVDVDACAVVFELVAFVAAAEVAVADVVAGVVAASIVGLALVDIWRRRDNTDISVREVTRGIQGNLS